MLLFLFVFVWKCQLESQIRALGGKYECFGLPYWDWGHDSLDGVTTNIYSSGLSGAGDNSNNNCVVGGPFADPPYYTEDTDTCLMRADRAAHLVVLTTSASMVTTMVNPVNEEFSGIRGPLAGSFHVGAHFVIGGDMGSATTAAYDPIFYLHHNYVDFLWAVWQDCHDYDEIPASELHLHPEAYDANPVSSVSPGVDDTIIFDYLDDFPQTQWSFVNDEDPTPRKMHDITALNVIYDRGDFWHEGEVENINRCGNNMNNEWFAGGTTIRRRRLQSTCNINFQECDDNPLEQVCDCDELVPGTCQVCNDGAGCGQCASGYFKLDNNHKCISCDITFGGTCDFCQDSNGCGQCNPGYERVYSQECGIWVCDGYDINPVTGVSPAPTVTSNFDWVSNTFNEIMSLDLSMDERNELFIHEVCQFSLDYAIDNGFLTECEIPDNFEDCSDMEIPANATDISITLEELLAKPGVAESECLQAIRREGYPWLSVVGGLLDLCNGVYDPKC